VLDHAEYLCACRSSSSIVIVRVREALSTLGQPSYYSVLVRRLSQMDPQLPDPELYHRSASLTITQRSG
jgi:hypothetical protein